MCIRDSNVTDRFPRLSLLTGLFGNALGYRHGDAEALEALQAVSYTHLDVYKRQA